MALIASYQAIAAASYAASLVNLASPDTDDLIDDGAGFTPGWDACSGWAFDGINNFLYAPAGLMIPANSGYSMLIRFSDFVPNALTTSGLCGYYITAGADAYFGVEDGASNWFYYNGDVYTETAVAMSNVGGVFGICAGRYMFDGVSGATNISGGDLTPHQFYIGCSGGAFDNAVHQFSNVKIQAVKIWDTELSEGDMQTETAAMQALVCASAPITAVLGLPTARFKITNAGYTLTKMPTCRCVSRWNRHKASVRVCRR